jgi:DeoR/GlpR family transcriptional regulator of sugar metabolism
MAIYNREDEYIKILSERDHTVRELSRKLFISEPTVRRDVIMLKKKDLVSSQAGTVKLKSRYSDQRIPLFVREFEHSEEKEEIAVKAAKYINDGYTVMIDASTTSYHLLPHLVKFKNLILITNGAKTAIEAASIGIKTICTGGELAHESFCYVGADAETVLRRYNADVAFFSCRGLSNDGRVTDNSILENNIRRIMMENSARSFLLCDKSKHGKVYINTLCHTKDLDGVISE